MYAVTVTCLEMTEKRCKFWLVDEDYSKQIHTIYSPSTTTEIQGKDHLKLIKLILVFDHIPGLAVTELYRNRNQEVCDLVFKALRGINFEKLRLVTFKYAAIDGWMYSKIFKQLYVRSTSNLILLRFRYSAIDELFLTSLLELLRIKYEGNCPLHYLSICRLYEIDLTQVRTDRVGYILSQISLWCEKLFHVQTDSDTNPLFLKTFFTAADMLSRLHRSTLVSLGRHYSLPGELYKSVDSLSEHVKVHNNQTGWSTDYCNSDIKFDF